MNRNEYLIFSGSDIKECEFICQAFLKMVRTMNIDILCHTTMENNNECFSVHYTTPYVNGCVKIYKSISKTWVGTKQELAAELFTAMNTLCEASRQINLDDTFETLSFDEFKSLKEGDVVYMRCGTEGRMFAITTILEDAYYNADCDEPGWEVETSHGICDYLSLYKRKKGGGEDV